MALIEYIGRKARKEDNVAGTGLIWLGAGHAHNVADPQAAAKLLAYDTVWRDITPTTPAAGLADAQPPAPPAPPPSPETPPRFALDGPAGVVVLDAMDDATVKAWAAENLEPHGIKVDGRKKGDSLKQAVIDAVKAATAEG